SARIDGQPQSLVRLNAEDRLGDLHDEERRRRLSCSDPKDCGPGIELDPPPIGERDGDGTPEPLDAHGARERFRYPRVRRARVDEHPYGDRSLSRYLHALIDVAHCSTATVGRAPALVNPLTRGEAARLWPAPGSPAARADAPAAPPTRGTRA